MLAEALLCFGASSTSMDEQGSDESNDKVESQHILFIWLKDIK